MNKQNGTSGLTDSIQVNSNVLRWAREMSALSPNKTSEETGIGLKRLLQLEKGQKQPALEELKAMSKTYKRTLATLLLDVPPKEKPLPKDRRTVNSEELNSFHFKTIMAVRKARALLNSYLELKTEFGITEKRIEFNASLHEPAINAARLVRKKLKLHEVRQIKNINQALEAYIEKVESLGIAIFQLSLVQDKLRGFSILDEAMPVIAIKRSDPPTAKIFTLFHELGHIILGDDGICDINFNQNAQQVEKWCNSFAADALIPAEELLNEEVVKDHSSSGKREWAKMDLVKIGNNFHAGPLAILRSLLELNLTSPEFYEEKHNAWNKPSFDRAKNPEGRNIPKETIKEKGRTYVSLAFKAYDQNRIDLKDLSDFLGVKLSYIPKTRQLLSSA
jgi:Zn-dependent peptidase ImmA (M78 family)